MNLQMRQRIARLHKTGLYVVVTIAFLGVALGGGLGPIMGAVFAVALMASWFVDERKTFSPKSARWWNALIIAFIAITAAQLLFTQEGLISAAIRFVLLLTTIKLFSRFGARDDLQIYALTFLIFAAATTVSQDLTYGVFFGLYVVAGTFSLALFHLHTELNPDTKSAARAHVNHAERSPFDRRYMMVLGAISAAIFASSLVIFFVFPRVGLGFFVKKSRDSMMVTGFSDSVELGSHGVLRDNPDVVMRVEFPDGIPPNYQALHWRVMTFDHYDGRAWSQSLKGTEESLPMAGRGAYDFKVARTEAWQPQTSGDPGWRADIYIEPLGTNLLPRLWPTGQVRFGSTELRTVWNPLKNGFTLDEYTDLRHTSDSEIGLAYSQTVLQPPDPNELRRQQYEKAGHRGPDPRYLQLPKMSHEFLRLAGQIGAHATTPYEKAEAVLNYLAEGYGYTTNLPPVDPEKPVESFVFDTRVGHCEYFASSAVLMLRAAGVPARLVNGYLGGDWNNIGNYLAVRQGDAHAWVEVFVPNFGWVPIDPTPASEVLPRTPGPVERWLRGAYDASRLAWMKWIIEYDLGSQIALVKKAGRFLAPASKYFSGNTDTNPQTAAPDLKDRWSLLPLVWGLLLVVLIWLIARWFGRRKESELRKAFARVERAGQKAGLPRHLDEGPETYLHRLATHFPAAAADLANFRQLYLSARFAGRPLGPRQLANLRRLGRSIRKAVRRR